MLVNNTGVKVMVRETRVSFSQSFSKYVSMSSTYISGNLYLGESFLSDKSMVLKHHPDKRKARGLKVGDGEDDYFTCITRGNEGTH